MGPALGEEQSMAWEFFRKCQHLASCNLSPCCGAEGTGAVTVAGGWEDLEWVEAFCYVAVL